MIMLCFSKYTHKIRLASEAGLILCYADIFNLTLLTRYYENNSAA